MHVYKLYASQTKILENETCQACLFEGICEGVSTSRRQLTPVFDKPAFSRFSQIFQPRLVVHSFWENREKAGL